MSGVRRSEWVVVALYAGLAFMLAQVHMYEIDFGVWGAQALARHDGLLLGHGDSPWVYRVGQPMLAEGTRRVLALAIDDGLALPLSYVGWRFVWTFVFLVLFDAWLRTWLDRSWAIAGTLLAAALHPATYRFYWFQPDSPLDLVVWVTAGLLTLRRSDAWLFPLIMAGAFVRETAVFVIVIHAALRFGTEPLRRLVGRCALLGLAWSIPFVGLRLLIGPRAAKVDPTYLIGDNLQLSWLLYAVGFLGALWVLPWLGFRRRPPELRRLAVALLATYLPLQFVFGRIREVRLLLPLAVVLLPLALLRLREDGEDRGRHLVP